MAQSMPVWPRMQPFRIAKLAAIMRGTAKFGKSLRRTLPKRFWSSAEGRETHPLVGFRGTVAEDAYGDRSANWSTLGATRVALQGEDGTLDNQEVLLHKGF